MKNLFRMLFKALIFGSLNIFLPTAFAAEDNSLFGTHWVRFEPLQIEGHLKGCSLVYLAVQADRAYLNGRPVVVNGSIQVRETSKNQLGLIFKIGLKDISVPGLPFVRPAFAYFQTEGGTTASAKQEIVDGDAGYKLFAVKMDAHLLKILEGLKIEGKISIGYNRKKNGMDVITPLDLSVADSEYTSDQNIIRKYSPEASQEFRGCLANVLENFSKGLSEK